jgi:PleD family two-component response regulator
MPLCSVDFDDLEEDDLVWQHHHYIACKDYDRTIMRKLNSIENLNPITQSIQQDQSEHIEKNSLKTKRIMLVEDEDDIALLFKMILKSESGLKVYSFADPLVAFGEFQTWAI